MRVLSRSELVERANLLAVRGFCQRPEHIAQRSLKRLLPRRSMSTLEWSENVRLVRKPDGTRTHWSRKRSAALVPIAEAHDNPNVREIIVPKPSRVGGTMIAENFAAKCLDNGPSWDVMWYLAGPNEVTSYADRVLRPIMEDHFADRLAKAGTDGNKKTLKRIGAQTFELMVMSATTTTNRQAGYIVFDEPDSYSKAWRSNFLEQGRQRQSDLGLDRKIYACAHPDVGWSGGISAAWVLSTQGIYVFRCPSCGAHGSPYPTRYWPDVPQFRLDYVKAPEGTPIDQRLTLAAKTAAIACPRGCALGEAERVQMIEEGSYMHKGQVLDIEAGIVGEVEENETWGFWVHVLMSGQVSLSSLARQIEGAIEHRERTGKADKIKQVLVRTFGEVFEGTGGMTGLDARALKERTRELALNQDGEDVLGYRLGEVPPWVKFTTLSIDVGHNKFDLLVRGWDNARRSWVIDRRTIRQRLDSEGVWRDIAPAKVQDDWQVLEAEIDRLYPLRDDPSQALPVACIVIDASDGNVTWKAYEFARRMDRKRWGAWRRVRCIKGNTRTTAPPLPPSPTKISKDSEGRPIEPVVTLHSLGVHQLKEGVLEDLAIDDHAPGQCYFPVNMPEKAYEELFNEPLIDGAFVRNGPNETLDLMGYAEAARLMLQPDRKNIDWSNPEKYPIWARPVSLEAKETDDAETPPKAAARKPDKQDLMSRFERLNRR